MRVTTKIQCRVFWRSLLLVAGSAALLLSSLPASAQISLGTANSFGVLAGSAVSNVGASVVTGNLGVSPGSAVTGFPPGTVTPPGVIHSATAVAAQAQIDVTTAYNALAGTPTLVDLTGTDLGGLTLTPGVYGFSSSAQLTGTLTLDAQGNPNALFIFKIGSTLTTASGSSVVVINGGSACNVYWQVGSSATLGTTTAFAGNILALASITLNTGASLFGRALARNGAVTLAGNSIAGCAGAPVVCPTITVNPATLPNGVVGVAYNQAVTASGGAAPYTYAVSSGTLSAGLSLDPATGAITGTPTAFGTFNFTITATDSNGCPGSRLYSMVIAAAACPAVMLDPVALPSGQIGSAYSQVVVASGGIAPYTYAVSAGSLPGGVTLNPATGAITGVPTAAGSFGFTITATDNNGCPGSRPYIIVIPAVVCPAILLNPATLPNGVVGTAYNQAVTASGGAAPYTYAVSGGTLPAGLSLNPATGAITGTPTAFGTFNFTITATDSNGCPGSRLYSMVIAATACPAITLSPVMLPNGQIGSAYSQVVVASGGTAPYTYAVSSGSLPAGMTLNSATGAITGIPTAAGSFSFTIIATDNNGCPGSTSYIIVIPAVVCPAILLSPSTLPAPFAGIAYNQSVTASGGTPPYTYSVTSGALPTGLSLNAATGAITGTTTATGNFSFTITATDAAGCTAMLGMALSVGGTSNEPIPTLSEWSLFLMMVLTGLVAIRYLRRN